MNPPSHSLVETEPEQPTGSHVVIPLESLVERYARMAHTFERRPVDRLLRGADVVVAGTALVVLSPVLLLCALAVLETGRPVLYQGARVGRAGEIFTMYKFRTLRADAETRIGGYYGAELTALTALEQTLVGKVLRFFHLDELPQLFNVLRGDMSLVGPRPIRPTFFEELILEIPAYWQRLVVRPGITGFAQLRLSREMTWGEKLAHDFEFVADRSLSLYLSVLAQTAWTVVRRAVTREGQK
jgi:lipopolysaccharide/colanic/teichoic acid biosynthesis glycosyltransferase